MCQLLFEERIGLGLLDRQNWGPIALAQFDWSKSNDQLTKQELLKILYTLVPKQDDRLKYLKTSQLHELFDDKIANNDIWVEEVNQELKRCTTAESVELLDLPLIGVLKQRIVKVSLNQTELLLIKVPGDLTSTKPLQGIRA